MTNKSKGKQLGLTTDEKEQLISLLDKIEENHCKNYDTRCFGWDCSNKSDETVCPIEYRTYLETNYQAYSIGFYCPLFIIRDVLEEE